MILVDLCGVPGSGKSFIFEELSKCERFISIPQIYTQKIKVLFRIIKKIFYFSLMQKIKSISKTGGNSFDIALLVNTLADIYTANLFLRSNDILIYDEGIIQKVVSFAYDLDINMELLFNRISIPDLIIYVECSKEIQLQRLKSRAKGRPGRFNNMTDRDFLDSLNKYEIKLNEAVSYNSQRTSVISYENIDHQQIKKLEKEIIKNCIGAMNR